MSERLDGLHDEVFVLANSAEDAKRVEEMNGCGEARTIKNARLKELAEKGSVNELHMPDTRAAIFEALIKERRRRNLEKYSACPDCDSEAVQYEPKEVVVTVDRIEVYSKGEGTAAVQGHIKVDGQELRGVQRITIDIEATKTPRVTVELLPLPKE